MIKSHEHAKKHQVPKRALAAATGLLALAAVAGCNSTSGGGEGNNASDSPSATATAPNFSQAPQPTGTPDAFKAWLGISADQVKFPGRVVLSKGSYQEFGITNPEPTITRDGKLLTIVDARRSFPQNPDYLTDSGTGVYTGPSYTAPKAEGDNGTHFIEDGKVVQVVAYAMGEVACNDGGDSKIWLDVTERPNGPTEWAPLINFGGGPGITELDASHIPHTAIILPTPTASTSCN